MVKNLLNTNTSSSSHITTEEPPPVYACKFIRLNPGVTKTNFACSLIFSFIMIFSYAGAGTLQLLILLDPDYYNVSQDRAGTLSSLILVIQSLVKIATVVPYGHLSDKFGRRTMIVIGAVSFFIGCLLVPMQKSIFPGFVIAKILTANAGSAFQSVPLLADYVADESRGKASAISGVMICVSALLANLVMKALFAAKFSLGACYNIVGVGVFAALLLNTLGLQKGTFHLKAQNAVIKSKEVERPFMESTKEAIQVFKGNNWLKISLVLQIFGSSDFIIFMSFIGLYVKSLFPVDTPAIDQNNAVNNLYTLIMLMMMVTNFTSGYLIDKKNLIIQVCMFALGGGAIALTLIGTSTSPDAVTLYLGSLLFGATLPALYTITALINIKHFPADKRGLMSGFCHLVAGFSYFVIASGGGLVYDHWRRDGPFLICAGLLIVAIVLVLKIYRKIKSEEKDLETGSPEENDISLQDYTDKQLELEGI